MDPQKFCLKWNDYRHSVSAAFEGLRQDEELVDMTLCCEGRKIRAHRMMLSACSPFFRELLKENPCQHPVFFLRDVSYQDLWSAIEFVYKGEVNVSQGNLASFLKTAEMLQLRGLTDDDNNKNPDSQPAAAAAVSPRPAAAQAGPVRRDSGSVWESEPPEATVKPAKRPRTQHTAGPPPPPPPPAATAAAATSVPLGPLAVKRETSPPSPPPPPPPPLPPSFGPAGEVGYSSEQEPDAGLRTILYHDLNSGPAAMALDAEGHTDDGGPTSLQLLEPDPSAERSAGRPPALPLGPPVPPPAAAAAAAENPGRHACQQCGVRFRNEGSLQHHMKVHQGRTVCPVCHVTYNRVHYLRTHMASKHGMSMPEVKQLLTAVHAQAVAAVPTQWTDGGAVGDPGAGGV